MNSLNLYSEPVAPTGNATADGLRRVMGAPTQDLLSVVVREAVQNSWDARLDSKGQPAEILIRDRVLTSQQANRLREWFGDRTPPDALGKGLRDWLMGSSLRVLEIADFGTEGLSGPEHADEALKPGEAAHFVDFLRNVGKTHETVGGGTYGFGKSSFYGLSSCNTILVDTVTRRDGQFIRRSMGSGLGSRYSALSGDRTRNFTGRHWWGGDLTASSIAPLRNETARRFATEIGLPPRTETATGTTVCILNPELDEYGSSEELTVQIVRLLLANFWPKMVVRPGQEQPALIFRVFAGDTEKTVPAPETIAPFNLFAQALNAVRQERNDLPRAGEVRTGRPVEILGHIAMQAGPRLARPEELLLAGDESGAGFPEELFRNQGTSHLAEMRSGELVVRYEQADRLPNQEWEWAGVFRTSSEEKIERAFADSEPPTHDSWNSAALTDREHRRWLNSYHRTRNRLIREFVAPASPVRRSGDSLGLAAEKLGSMLPGLGEKENTSSSAGSRERAPRRKGRFRQAEFVKYDSLDGEHVAVFQLEWVPGSDQKGTVSVELFPRVLFEGRLVEIDQLPPGMEPPLIMAIRAQDDKVYAGSSALTFEASEPMVLRAQVRMNNQIPCSIDTKMEFTDAA